jgi:hypothetical protein
LHENTGLQEIRVPFLHPRRATHLSSSEESNIQGATSKEKHLRRATYLFSSKESNIQGEQHLFSSKESNKPNKAYTLQALKQLHS